MSMVGSFLVRSGILTSVHAFAVDPQRGFFILILLTLYIGGALALFGLRVGTVREGATFEPVSREGALVLNNLLLRSEEHTSELQSLMRISYAVFCLKKKNIIHKIITIQRQLTYNKDTQYELP